MSKSTLKRRHSELSGSEPGAPHSMEMLDPDPHIMNRVRAGTDPQTCKIHMFLGLPDPDPLVKGMVPDPDPSISQQK
jgi:hypothetical protein